jgi:hypothetical protein
MNQQETLLQLQEALMLWDQGRWDAALTSGQLMDLVGKAGNLETWGQGVMNLIMDGEEEGEVLIRAMQRLQEVQVGVSLSMFVMHMHLLYVYSNASD